ncbi:hypothetical protein EQG64_34295 [Streptomyces sp. S6]|nr:hypothetical protein EQG64_34295 [Streptomyces sp. S6]
MGGTNAHVVLEEAPPAAEAPPGDGARRPAPAGPADALVALLNVVRSPQAPRSPRSLGR